ncbi:MAG: permease [Desulfopila sp.]|nr:permease [Desulfopila sp.]
MKNFIELWHEAATTSIGFFWMAFWAFALGYLISSMIQVLVTRSRMQRTMGESGPKSMALGTFFGFISSSCSFAALSTTRALFQKGAGLAPALAFMLASTNLVIELGIVIAIFLSWQFVVGEYLGGLLLILFAWLFVRLFYPKKLVEEARRQLKEDSKSESRKAPDWKKKITSSEGWQEIGQTYVMEWNMVWRDVLIGFTIAGILSAFLPQSFYTTLFIGSGTENAANPGFPAVLAQTLVGPIAAFFTFIGSMGNIPLAAVLYSHGVSFAGVMAFIFSDLVVFPVLRINTIYYGWKMAVYILILLLSGLVIVSIVMHYGLAAFNLLPEAGSGTSPADQQHFTINYGFFLNIIFFAVSLLLVWLWRSGAAAEQHEHHDHGSSKTISEYILNSLSVLALLWLAGGIVMTLTG